MMWVSFATKGSKQRGKRPTKLQSAHKLTKAKKGGSIDGCQWKIE